MNHTTTVVAGRAMGCKGNYSLVFLSNLPEPEKVATRAVWDKDVQSLSAIAPIDEGGSHCVQIMTMGSPRIRRKVVTFIKVC